MILNHVTKSVNISCIRVVQSCNSTEQRVLFACHRNMAPERSNRNCEFQEEKVGQRLKLQIFASVFKQGFLQSVRQLTFGAQCMETVGNSKSRTTKLCPSDTITVNKFRWQKFRYLLYYKGTFSTQDFAYSFCKVLSSKSVPESV